ncbi:MAG: DUF4333 domain-containing protein [Tildeniella nuda ZEHNDER 1965/U140]|jgi:hypothetical protein|nr:DUF4333 domain-containing protein [Tildeniella nuda ZEHNDER 1965/U140]
MLKSIALPLVMKAAMNQKWKPRSVWNRVIVGVSTIALSACSKTLDTAKLEGDIQQMVIRQGGVSLKTVSCPKKVALAAGQGFDCVGTLDSGDTLAIPVKQSDANGTTTWEIPSAKGLLNLTQLESLFQQTIQQQGQFLSIDCGKGYRSVKPGDRFECKVAKASRKAVQTQKAAGKKAIDPKQPETIIVTVDPQNNVNWQQVLPAPAVAVASANLPASANSTPQPIPTIAAQDRAKLAPEILQKLDQIGGGDSE